MDDGYTVLTCVSSVTGESSIFGIVFQGGQCVRGCTNSQLSFSKKEGIRGANIKIEQCEFKSTSMISVSYDNDVGTLNINNCYFNHVPAPKYGLGDEIFINASTFEGHSCYFIAQDGRKITISNCTMYDCEQVGLVMNSAPSSRINFMNNTIYSNKKMTTLSYDLQPTLFMIGNIIACNYNYENIESINSSHNVYLKPTDVDEEKIGTDIYTDEISFFLNNQLSSVDNVITPILVMTSDTLPDGTSLRFPLSETKVTTDQRKKSRFRMTSMGSYEVNTKDDIIPTAFTPFDSNGKNDIFMLDHEVYIYDVYGMLICHSENGWNGMIKEEKANAGIYVYAVKTASGEIKRGTIELLIQQ